MTIQLFISLIYSPPGSPKVAYKSEKNTKTQFSNSSPPNYNNIKTNTEIGEGIIKSNEKST